MMDLIFCVNTHETKGCTLSAYDRIKERMRYIGSTGFQSIRINLKTFNEQECEKILLLLSAINDVKSSFLEPVEVYVDIPFPFQKYRMNVKAKLVEVKEGDIITIHGVGKTLCSDYDFQIDKEFFDELRVGNNIVYADGEGVFSVLNIADNFITIRADNSFTVYTNKSLLECYHKSRVAKRTKI